MQIVLGAMRPAVVAYRSAGASILLLGIFQAELGDIVLSNIRWVEVFNLCCFLIYFTKI